MQNLFVCVIVLTVSVNAHCQIDGGGLVDRGYVERDGLPHFLRSVEGGQGRPANIAFLGGSITESPGGYSEQVFAWMREEFADVDLRFINAGVGGTDSTFGAFRLDRDVLAHEPDLIFVEFAVNDSDLPDAMIVRAMEGIVRQVWKRDVTTELCFVYTINTPMIETLLDGTTPHSIAAMERVADCYGIPSIFMGLKVIDQIRSGEMVLKGAAPTDDRGHAVYSHDGTHPWKDTGHRLFAHSVASAIDAMRPAGVAKPHALSEPLDPQNLERAKIVSIDPGAHLIGSWKKLDGTNKIAERFGRRMPTMFVGSPGDFLSIRFKGTAVGVCDLKGPDAGAVRLAIDRKDSGTAKRFDAYCTDYRMNSVIGAWGLPEGEHEVTFTILSDELDKPAILAARSQVMDDPERFSPVRWYVGGIMVIGEPLG